MVATLREWWRMRRFLWHVLAVAKALNSDVIRTEVAPETDKLTGIAVGSLAERDNTEDAADLAVIRGRADELTIPWGDVRENCRRAGE